MEYQDQSIPNSPFDKTFITSYLIPGAILLLGLIIISITFRESFGDWVIVKKQVVTDVIENRSLLFKLSQGDYSLMFQILSLGIVVFSSIILGNTLSVFGSFLFDHLWYKKTIGYPYERFLSIPSTRYYKNGANIMLFMIVNLFAIIYLFIDKPKWIHLWIFLVIISFFIAIALIVKNNKSVRRFNAKEFIKLLCKKKGIRVSEFTGLTSKYNKFQNEKCKIEECKIEECKIEECKIVHFKEEIKNNPLTKLKLTRIIDSFIYLKLFSSKPLGLTVEFDNNTQQKFIKKYEQEFDSKIEYSTTEIFWNVYIYMFKNEPELYKSAFIQHKKTLLLRNLAAAAVILLLLMFLIKPFLVTESLIERIRYWSIAMFAIVHLLLIGYNHVNHIAFTKFLFRGFIMSDKNKKNRIFG